MNKHDVLIVGAGPSGLQTARRLAERGLDVLVLEKKERIGEAVNCTGLIGTEVFDEFDLRRESILRPVQEVRLVSPGGSTLDYRHPFSFAHVVDREGFDRSIGDQAQAAGAEIRTGTEVVDIVQSANRVEITARTEREEDFKASAGLAVIATGIRLDLSRKAGLGHPAHYLRGAQVEVEAEGEDIPTIFAGNDIAAGGFAWAVPSRPGRVKYGLITAGDARKSFRIFETKHLRSRLPDPSARKVNFKSIAQGLTSRTSSPRVLAVGEAAGQVKTTTGGGVAFGLRCAEIAARVIAGNIKREPASGPGLAEYERLWKRELRTEILLGFYARKIWSRMSDSHIERVFEFARQDGIIPLIREKGAFDHQGELIRALLHRFSLFGVLDGILQRTPHLN
jgi:digeranylgeranylglycerophospholipid reductase